jgi:hypothetical protein
MKSGTKIGKKRKENGLASTLARLYRMVGKMRALASQLAARKLF